MRRSIRAFLVALFLVCMVAETEAIPAFGARHPDPSPDGKWLAFDWRGDIWIVGIDGGKARRITDHIAHDALPRWSPDGKEIAFTSDRHGNSDIFVVGIDGGVPERLTFHTNWDRIQDWSPDGETIYFGSWRGGRFSMIYAVGRDGGRPVRVFGDRGYNAVISPDGQWIAYIRGYSNWWRKGYRGSANREIWIRPLAGGASVRITDWDGDDDRPHWSADGRALFFQSEREDGVLNLYRQNLRFEGNTVAADGAPTKLTNLVGDGVRHLSVSRGGEIATFERLGELYVVPTTGGQPRPMEIDCPGDLKTNEITRQMKSSGATEFAFVVEGEIYAAPIKEDELKDPIRLTETDSREKDLAWLDEHTLVFVSDRHGGDDIFALRSTDEDEPRLGKSRYREAVRLTESPETDAKPMVSPDRESILFQRGTKFLWTMKPDGSDEKLLLDIPNVLHVDWSPDSRYVAYSITTLGHAEDIFIHDVRDRGEPINVSNHPNDDFHPLWTDDGKRLSWASRTEDGYYSLKYLWLTKGEADKSEAEREREEEDEESDENGEEDSDDDGEEEEPSVEVKIDFDDIPDRIHTVATVRGFYWDYDASPDGKNYALRTNVVEEMELWTVDWKGEHLRRMTRGGANPDLMTWNEDGDRVRYISRGKIFEIENEEGESPSQLSFSVELTVDAAARRMQKLEEAWRLLYDGFYDANFHGVDWPAMREKYRPLAAAGVTTEDFNDALRQMIGELNASHLGVYGPYRGGGDETGFLGFTPDDSYTGPGVRVAELLPRGPLDREGKRVQPGEVIYAIDGKEIGASENYFPLLNHKRGKEVDLLVADTSRNGERKITVEPVGGGRVWRLTYKKWTDDLRTMVEALSQGRIGYLHMDAMGDDNWDIFIEDLFSRARGKEGLILDVRENSGGSIHDQVLTFLSRRPYAYQQSRGDRKITYNSLWRWDGPIVVLINEGSYSDGEIFPYGFKQLGLGKVVGVPTFGAVIGTNDVDLIDGTGFRVPGTGWWRMDGRNLENDPVTPDIYVREVPEENLQGKDIQVERAVEECLRMLEER